MANVWRRRTARVLWALARRLGVDRLPSFRARFEATSGLPYDPAMLEAVLRGAPLPRPVLTETYACPHCGHLRVELLVGSAHRNPATGGWDWAPGLQEGASPPAHVPPGCPACGARMEPSPVTVTWEEEDEDG